MNNCIENNMARLMDSQGSSSSTPAAHTLPPAVEKVIALVDRFVGKYGSVQLEIFRLPTSSTAELQRYLNSLTITLRRQGVIAAYAWQYHPSEAPTTCSSSTSIPHMAAFRAWFIVCGTHRLPSPRSTISTSTASITPL